MAGSCGKCLGTTTFAYVWHTANACPYLAHRRLSSTTMLNIMFVSVSSPPQARTLVAVVVSLGLPVCRSATSHFVVVSLATEKRPCWLSIIILFQFCSVPTTLLFLLLLFSSSNRVALPCASSHGNHSLQWNGGKLCEQTPRFCFAVSV